MNLNDGLDICNHQRTIHLKRLINIYIASTLFLGRGRTFFASLLLIVGESLHHVAEFVELYLTIAVLIHLSYYFVYF